MLKLTIPDMPNLYKDLIAHDRVVRVVACRAAIHAMRPANALA